MFMAAARALAEASPARLDPGAPLLPPVADLRDVSARVAVAVGEEAHRAGLSAAEPGSEEIETLVRRKIWVPDYRPYQPVEKATAQLEWSGSMLRARAAV
jgi:malate dehydrogenase (oxaloacetate-decarboxylating)